MILQVALQHEIDIKSFILIGLSTLEISGIYKIVDEVFLEEEIYNINSLIFLLEFYRVTV